MDFKFSKDSDDSQQQDAPGEKKQQSTLLVLLLILIGGFTYVYFFTGLIKPQETQKTAEAPVASQQAVKIPLPARSGEPDKPEGKATEKSEVPKAAAPPPDAAIVTAAKPAVAPAKPAAPPAATTVPASSKQKEEPKKTETEKPGDKQPLPTRVADKKGVNIVAAGSEAKKPAAEPKKPAAADKKNTPAADGAKKPASAVQAKLESGSKAKKAVTGSWMVVVGNYVLGEALSADMGRVRKAGFIPVVKPFDRKKTTMNRLFVSEFNDRETAQSTMGKLKRLTSDAFVIEQGGRFAVYAGSYLQSESANSEKERLKAAGFTTTLTQADIAIPSQRLSIGPFKSKNDADAALARLKSSGIKASISQI